MSNNTIPGQMTIFDFIENPYEEQKKNENKIKEIEEREILRGSGFKNGKERIYKFFNEYHTEKEQADFLKKEYGVGGWSIEEGFCNHNANGIDIEFDSPIGKTSAIHNGWLMVARIIKRLVDSGLYKPDEPKCRIAEECEAYPRGCGGTIDQCRFGGPFKWSNKTEQAAERKGQQDDE